MMNKMSNTPARVRRNAVVQCNCMNGVRWAGFIDSVTGTFQAVTTIQTPYDVEKFMDAYGVDVVTTEYIGCL